MLAIAVKSWVF